VDGRRPEGVTWSDPKTDASRRDFTVNGLFEVPATGEVLDFVGGRADLSARLIRAIGDPEARFREDHLRLLRAVRFSVQLSFAIEPATMAAVRRLAPLAADVSAERTRDELVKVLTLGRGKGLRLLAKAGLLPVVLPEAAAMRGVPQPPQFHPEGDVFVHTALVLDRLDLSGRTPEEAEALVLSAFLHDVAKPRTMTVDPDGRLRFNGHDAEGVAMTESFLGRLRFPTRETERVAALVGRHMVFPNLPKMRRGRLRTFLGDPDFPLHLALHRADCGASHGDLSLARFCEETLSRFQSEPVLPPPLLTGKDLIAMGYAPGPRMGEILAFLRDQQLDGALASKDDAVRCVRERYPAPGLEPPSR
jgi:tRNA nucleotidyltransferase/poly(A) polymerase